MRHSVPGHYTCFAFISRIINGRPVYISRLGLDQPEVAAFESACEIVGCPRGQIVMMACRYVPVPCSHVEVGRYFIMIIAIVPAHEIVRNPFVRRKVWAEQINLKPLELPITLGNEAL